MPNAGLPSAPIPLVSASDEDGCPLRLRPLRPSPAAALPLPGLGTLPALPAAACAPDFLGTEPGWAAPARPLDLSTASMPAAALAAFVEWLPGLSRAAGALLLGPDIVSKLQRACRLSHSAALRSGLCIDHDLQDTVGVMEGRPLACIAKLPQQLVHESAIVKALTQDAVAAPGPI